MYIAHFCTPLVNLRNNPANTNQVVSVIVQIGNQPAFEMLMHSSSRTTRRSGTTGQILFRCAPVETTYCRTWQTTSPSSCRSTGIWPHVILHKAYDSAIKLWRPQYACNHNVPSRSRLRQNEATCLSKPQVSVSTHSGGEGRGSHGRRWEVCCVDFY